MNKEKINNKNKKPINLILVIFVVILSLVQILLSNRIATWGKNLKSLEEEIKIAQEINSQLELEIVSSGRLFHLAQKAETLGFIKNPSIINLTSQVPVALSSYNR